MSQPSTARPAPEGQKSRVLPVSSSEQPSLVHCPAKAKSPSATLALQTSCRAHLLWEPTIKRGLSTFGTLTLQRMGQKSFRGTMRHRDAPCPPTTHTQPAAWPSPARSPAALPRPPSARFPPLFLPGWRGPLQGSIRSATFWPATRIPGTQRGPAAKPAPSAWPHLGLQPSWPHGKSCWATGFTAQRPPRCRSPG